MGMKKKAVVLLSGGLDSATTLAIANAEGYELYALSFDYGQRHKIELDASRRIAEFYKVKKHLVIDINLQGIGGSALTSSIEVPKDRDQIKNQIPVTYVPARNTIFLSLSLAWAETLKASDIFIGVNAIDYSGYPDCRPEYIKAFEAMANLATKVSVEGVIKFKIQTPLIELTKADLIKKGNELGVDYSLTWSCYDPQLSKLKEGFIPCDRCDSCILRARGFEVAGLTDPLQS